MYEKSFYENGTFIALGAKNILLTQNAVYIKMNLLAQGKGKEKKMTTTNSQTFMVKDHFSFLLESATD